MSDSREQILTVFRDLLQNDEEEAMGLLEILQDAIKDAGKFASATVAHPAVTGLKIGDWVYVKQDAWTVAPKFHGKFCKIRKVGEKRFYLWNVKAPSDEEGKSIWPFFGEVRPLTEEELKSSAFKAAQEEVASRFPQAETWQGQPKAPVIRR